MGLGLPSDGALVGSSVAAPPGVCFRPLPGVAVFLRDGGTGESNPIDLRLPVPPVLGVLLALVGVVASSPVPSPPNERFGVFAAPPPFPLPRSLWGSRPALALARMESHRPASLETESMMRSRTAVAAPCAPALPF